MRATTFALIAAVVYLALGFLALVPVTLAPPPADAPATQFTVLYGYFLGLFPVNIVLSALHVAMGVWGIAAWSRAASAEGYARASAVVFAALAVFGVIPGLNTFFGLMPLFGADVALHGLTAVAAYFGWRHAAKAQERRASRPDRRERDVLVARERRMGLSDRRERLEGGMSPA